MGCRTSAIDQQFGKFDTRQRRVQERREKMREQGINDSQLGYSRLCLKYELSWGERTCIFLSWMHLDGFFLSLFVAFSLTMFASIHLSRKCKHACLYCLLEPLWQDEGGIPGCYRAVGGLGRGLNAPIVSLSGSSHRGWWQMDCRVE